MNILYLTNRLPYPLHSGYLRQFYFIRELSLRHRVTLVSMVAGECPGEYLRALAEVTERVVTVPARNLAQRGLSRRWGRLTSAFRPDAAISAFCAAVRNLVREEAFDVAVLHGLTTVAALQHLDGLRIIADLCDANSTRFLAAARYTSLFRLPLILWDYLSARRLERKFIRSRAHLVFATPRDQQALLGDTPRSGTVVPNGVDVEYWRRGTGELGVDTLIFTGAMNYPPNADAACQLIRHIVPQVRREAPHVQLLIVGRDPPSRLVAAARRPGVTLTGAVPDIRPFLDRATVFVAPLRYGAGIQNKLLQSLAMQVPVIASPVAVEGLEAADGEQPPVQVATDSEEFANLVCRQLAPAPRTPCSAGRAFVERHFRWSQCGRLLDQLIHSA
jgi:hypothetical protein